MIQEGGGKTLVSKEGGSMRGRKEGGDKRGCEVATPWSMTRCSL